MNDDKNLIHLHQLEDNICLCTLVYQDYLDESYYLKIIVSLYNYYFERKVILLPFSINFDLKIVIFYNIYNKFSFKKLDKILDRLNNYKNKPISYISFNSKISRSLKPTKLPKSFDKLGNRNIEILDSYLKELKYKIFNLKDNGII